MLTRLGWIAVYADKHRIKQYPDSESETNIGVMGEWKDFRLEYNLPIRFFVGKNGLDLINGALYLEGHWYPPPPGCQPIILIYYRIMRATLNGGFGQQCWHMLGYEDVSGAIVKLQVPDDGSKPAYVFGDQESLHSISDLITVSVVVG